ncbi:hypothetical protein KFK09_019823 [Dendrobium nobile]|uniref:Uncharacterized protein n=1 Tax=Dendrobium nobile TaxID=94219 RepID=A0A8T3AXR1_DENNO|nr:hypothetical protein KFK09_019823 [Dendrobium nobile]
MEAPKGEEWGDSGEAFGTNSMERKKDSLEEVRARQRWVAIWFMFVDSIVTCGFLVWRLFSANLLL